MKIDRKVLHDKLNAVAPGLATKEVIEQSDSFVLKAGKIITFNDEISVSAELDIGIEGAILPSRQLVQLLQKMPDDEIDVELKENQLIVKGKGKTAKITVENKIALPLDELEYPKKFKKIKDPEQFLSCLCGAAGVTSKDATRPILTCVHVTEKHLEATDNFQIGRYLFDGFPFECLIPARVVGSLKGYKIKGVGKTDNWIHFECNGGVIFSFRRIVEQYPDIDASGLLEYKGEEFKIPATLRSTLERAGIFTKSDFENDESVSLYLEKGAIIIKAINENSEYTEKIKCAVKVKETIGFEIHPRFLYDCKADTKACICARTLGIKTDKFQYAALLSMI